ncbi:multidrug resistance-associated ABC transporter [Flammula alnicola]|nr:multidrug resistance-associated ABC transporter [Flammula alnicola]
MKSPFENPFRPPPAPPGFGSGKVLPESSATLLSKLVFQWLAPFLAVGFSRPLEKEDFWKLPPERLTASITDDVEKNFYSRCPPEKRPGHMKSTSAATTNNVAQEGPSDEDRPSLEKLAEEHVDLKPPLETLTAVSTQTAVLPVVELEAELPAETRTKTDTNTRGWSCISRRGKKPKPQYDESLFLAIHRTFFTRIWNAGVLKLLSDTLQTTTPLLNKVILTWLTQSYVYVRATEAERAALGLDKPKGIGYGIGLAIALFVMQESASLMTNHYMQSSMITGLSIRTGIIGSVFRKSLRLSGRARVNHSTGQITTMISTDATRLDRFSQFGHNLWVSPIQLAIGIGLLLGNLGYSALVGLGVLVLGFPIQIILVKIMFTQRKKGVKITDKRVRLTTEVLQGIRLVKFYAWEAFYAHQIGELRGREIRTIRKVAMARSLMIAMVTFMPILASVLSFITYALSGHDLNIAIIFSSLQLFNIIRAPLIFLPFVLAALSDALVALGRISTFLTSEDLPEPYPVDHKSPVAVQVDGDFVWETVYNPIKEKGGKFGPGGPDMGGHGYGGRGGRGGAGKAEKDANKKESKEKSERKWWKPAKKDEKGGVLPSTTTDVEKEKGVEGEERKEKEKEKEQEHPFELKNLKFIVPQGAFIGIVGHVGCGKSSVLQALIGEMRRTRGEVVFGGKVSYAPQIPWIRNATLRENVLFGQPDEEDRFRQVIRACSLEHDLEVLPNGEDTEIGEKGINLSGGQKARVSLARAAYSDSNIVLLDDPLSAVDAYVGKSILENCLLSGPLAQRTRILVTHALHVLDKTDYIYVMDNGAIIEQGTYADLMSNSIIFSRTMDEYGSLETEFNGEEEASKPRTKRKDKKDSAADDSTEEGGPKKPNAALMQIEERNTGAVTWTVYRKYLGFAGGVIWAPFILLLLVVTQGAQVGNNLFLGFWTANSIPGFKQGNYMAVYAALGVAQAIFTFILSFSFAIASLVASLNLFKSALKAVLRSPTSFFDTTPMGRILSRLSKDQDTLDTELAMTLMQFLSTFSSVLGTVALVFYTFPYLGIIFLPLSILYYVVAAYYRRSSVETKRLDSLMRSILYGSFSETLTGLATIRAYREQNRSVKDAETGLDMENRAYYMTISIQRWLAVRLDLFGNILIFGIGLFAAGFRHSVNPAKIGVVLSYTLSITQVFSQMVSQFAQNEQNMNAVERVLHYSELEPEGDATTPNDPPPSWPSEGRIVFNNVEMSYREGLPLVLEDISFQVNPGEKIGIVGRTGAGKSSLLQALFRTVELRGGYIEIDGHNIRNMGLDVLRSRLALVPQDGTLFLGTLRENLDPLGLRTDAELISALQRAWLLPKDGSPDPVAEAKFSLDSTVGDEGANFSAGEKQLLALCRALVKNSKIIILDEATSNVDVETDAKLQRTIQIEFASSTLLCIAHRLNTIAYYDRVIVMDEGKIAEFDTVLNLFDKEDSIFRSLCDEANLQRADIVRIRTEHDIILRA